MIGASRAVSFSPSFFPERSSYKTEPWSRLNNLRTWDLRWNLRNEASREDQNAGADRCETQVTSFRKPLTWLARACITRARDQRHGGARACRIIVVLHRRSVLSLRLLWHDIRREMTRGDSQQSRDTAWVRLKVNWRTLENSLRETERQWAKVEESEIKKCLARREVRRAVGSRDRAGRTRS